MLVVYKYCRFKLSLDEVVELMAIRGIQLCHQTVHMRSCGRTIERKTSIDQSAAGAIRSNFGSMNNYGVVHHSKELNNGSRIKSD